MPVPLIAGTYGANEANPAPVLATTRNSYDPRRHQCFMDAPPRLLLVRVLHHRPLHSFAAAPAVQEELALVFRTLFIEALPER